MNNNTKSKKYYLLCVSESNRLNIPFSSREEAMCMIDLSIAEHNKVISDPALHLSKTYFEIVEEEE